MDNQQFSSFDEQNQPYATPAGPKNAKYFRARAREALKGNLVNTAVGGFVYNLVVSGVSVVGLIPFYVIMFTVLLRQSFSPEDRVPAEFFATVLIGFAVMMGILILGMILVGGPAIVGYSRMHLDVIDGVEPRIGTIFSPFKTCFGKAASLYFRLTLLACLACLPIILLLFVGIMLIGLENGALGVICMLMGYVITIALAMVIYYRYSMSYYILAEYPEMSAGDALRNSAMLMKGKMWKLFCLDFSFIGWVLLVAVGGMLTCGVGMLIGIYVLMAYMQTARAAFYDEITNRAAARQTVFPSLDPDDYISGEGSRQGDI